jgi:hypothetical protein
LFLFVDVFVVGVSTAKIFHHMSRLFKAWKIDLKNLNSNKITWERLQEEDKKQAIADFLDYRIPCASFASFITDAISLFV